MYEDDPNERPTLPAPDPFNALAAQSPWPRFRPLSKIDTPANDFFVDAWEEHPVGSGDPTSAWWLEARRRWLVRWVFAIVGMAAIVLSIALTMKLLL